LAIFLFVVWLLASIWLINKMPFFKKLPVPTWLLVSLFLLKVAAGSLYAWFYMGMQDYMVQADTWRMFGASIDEKNLLLNQPLEFVRSLFVDPYTKGTSDMFVGQNSYWNDLKSNVIIKLLAILNLLTASNYFVNVVLFSLFNFVGPVAFARVLLQCYPNNKWTVILGSFLLPSFLFWCSGIHKDGLIFSLLSLMVYHFFYALKQDGFTLKRLGWISICWLLIFPLRNYVAFAALPAFFAWWLSGKKPKRTWLVFFGTYAVGLLLFFLLPKISPSLNFPSIVVKRQQEFFSLQGNSFVATDTLEDNIRSFANLFPQAANHALLRPYVTEAKKITYIPAAIEVVLAWALVLLVLLFPIRQKNSEPLITALLFLSISLLLLVGYTVPFLAAIVRYRSIYLPFLIVPILVHIDWPRLRQKIGIK
jgi:hypothetical protein